MEVFSAPQSAEWLWKDLISADEGRAVVLEREFCRAVDATT